MINSISKYSDNIHSLEDAYNNKTLYNTYYDSKTKSVKQHWGLAHLGCSIKRFFKWLAGSENSYLQGRYKKIFTEITTTIDKEYHPSFEKRDAVQHLMEELDSVHWSFLGIGKNHLFLNKIAYPIILATNSNEEIKDTIAEEISKNHSHNNMADLLNYLQNALHIPPPLVQGKVEPPISDVPVIGQLQLKNEEYLKRFNKGEKPEKLLIKAFDEKLPALALFFAKRVGNVDALSRAFTSKKDKDLYTWLLNNLNKPAPTPETLDFYALKLGYGYKTANLLVLQEEAKKISREMKSAVVKVPPPEPVSHFELKSHVEQTVNVDDLWEKFLNTFDPEMKKQFLERKADDPLVPIKISPEGVKIIHEIQSKIVDHFRANPYNSLQIDEWLKNNPCEFVIVRSTGKEDTENNANAGGNDSIPFVKANANDISNATARVLASYFGEKSVTQRLSAGDKSVFEEAPFMPVLIQKMVMEKNEGIGSTAFDIPRSGVLITKEPGKDEDVTLIQTGLGNNEGVVTSQVGVDTYMVNKEGNIHNAIRMKRTRFINALDKKTKKYVAKEIDNDNEFLIKHPALTDDIIRDMKKMSDHIAKYYGKGVIKAMDMEFSVMLPSKEEYVAWEKMSQHDKVGKIPPKATIFLLQARPLQLSQSTKPKSYLSLDYINTLAKENVLKTETLIEGNGDVRVVDNNEEILFVKDLPQGLDQYLHAKDPSKIKVIVSAKNAPSTSHEAVTLRPKGVVVMVVENQDKFSGLKNMASKLGDNTPIIADPQRGMMMLSKNKADAEKAIQKGFISYPVQRQLSVRPGPVAVLINLLKLTQTKIENKEDVKKKYEKNAVIEYSASN